MTEAVPDRLILGHLTVLDQSPPHVLRIAERLGFRQIGLRLLASRPGALSYPLFDLPDMMEETLRILRETGISVYDVDVCKLTPQTVVRDFEPFFAAAQRLGAQSVLVTCGDADKARFLDKLDQFADLAGRHGMTADLEFMLFTPTVPTLDVALEVVESVGRDNLGVLVDTIHFDRTGAAAKDLARVPRHRLNYVHLTDARGIKLTNLDEITEDSRANRMIPGEGGLDLAAMLRALPADLPLCIEVSNAALDKSLGAEERARRARQGTLALLRSLS